MKKWFLYGGLVVALAIPLALWLPGYLQAGPGDFPCEFGRLFGLTGFTLALFQVGLSSRLKIFERGMGLDKLMGAHRLAGLFGFSFMLAHPVFHFTSDFINLGYPVLKWPMLLGLGAFLLAILTIGTAILFKKIKIRYGTWKGLHWVNFFLIPIVFTHSMLLGTDINAQPLLKYWWIVLGAAYIALVTAIVVDRIKARRHPYQVTEVVKETPDTWSLHLKGPAVDHKPGQFAILTLHREGQKPEAHPFTLASSPLEKDLSVSVKAVGDFTSTIKDTTTADRAVISAPFGTFSFLNYDAPNLVFIAGGIGITPFMSMLRYMAAQNIKRNVLLLWGNKTEHDIAFRNELNKISARMPTFRMVHVLSSQPDWVGEKGYIDQALLQKYLDGFDNPQFFVCGPPVMMDKMVKTLLDMKVPENRIHFERFALR